MNLDERDERLDRLLRELGAVKVDVGFGGRVLRGAQMRAAAERPVAHRVRNWGLSGVLVGAGVCALLVGVMSRRGDGRLRVTPPVLVTPTHEKPGAEAHSVQEPIRGAEAPRFHRNAVVAANGLRVAQSSSAAAARESEGGRSAEARVSFPAPPAPLTEQERLLRRIAHTGDPQEFATLNAEARARVEAARGEAYEAYFAAPPPSADVLETIKLQKIGERQ